MALPMLLKEKRKPNQRPDSHAELLDDTNVRVPSDIFDTNPDPMAMKFQIPPYSPRNFVEEHFGHGTNMQFAKGTTTLAFVYKPATPKDKGGLIVSVDSRASSGLYISSKTVLKVLPITDRILGTMAGGAADCQFWIALLSKNCKLYELENKERITVAAASKLLQNMLYNYRGMGLSVGTMIAGYDKRGPSLYYVDAEGNRCQSEKFAVGSGQMNAYGILDTFYKPVMTDEEAIDLGRKAIMHSTFRDSGSGGGNNMFHITEEGWKQLDNLDVSEMYYKFMAEKKREFHQPQNV